ncbi:EEF1A lysine methyltransferase 4 [Polymixia lowei]
MEHMPDDNSRYKDVDYWDERYKTEKCFDWLGKFSKFQHLLEKHTKKHDSILISRVLKPGGRFLSVTFSQPHFRKRLYARCEYNWSIKHHTYGDGFHYFLYVLTKGEELSPEDAALERRLLEEDKAPPTPITTMQYEESESDFLGKFCL